MNGAVVRKEKQRNELTPEEKSRNARENPMDIMKSCSAMIVIRFVHSQEIVIRRGIQATTASQVYKI